MGPRPPARNRDRYYNGGKFARASERNREEAQPHGGPQGPKHVRYPFPPHLRPGIPRGMGNRKFRAHGNGMPGRNRGGLKTPAHERHILHNTGREKTPEQLEGMVTDGQVRFAAVDSSHDDQSDSHMSDFSGESEAEEGENRGGKRAKTRGASVVEQSTPKWSNPDPYTVLPPPSLLSRPKKDIVQVIRKAKIEQDPKNDSTNAVQENADFIALDLGDSDPTNDQDTGHAVADTSVVEKSMSMNEFSPRYDLRSARHAATYQQTVPLGNHQTTFSMEAQPRLENTSGQSGPSTRDPPERRRFSPPPPPTTEAVVAQLASQARGTKRKFSRPTPPNGEITGQWRSSGFDSTPWHNPGSTVTNYPLMETLNLEIKKFSEYVRPHPYEERLRSDLIARVDSVVRRTNNFFASAEVRCFGSFAADLYLPTSDMDLVALSPRFLSTNVPTFGQKSSQLYMIANHITANGIAAPGTVQAITKANVPLVKFVDKKTGLKVDLSFDNYAGIAALETFKSWKEEYPAMPTMVVLIKQLLAMRNLSEVFEGGIGGFTTICLVTNLLSRMTRRYHFTDANQSPEYGETLLEFLDYYGDHFDIRRTGIRMNPIGYFDKITTPHPRQNPDRLTIIDPNNSMNDISGGSRSIDLVMDVFRRARAQLDRRLEEVGRGQRAGQSILGCLLAGNYSIFEHQRQVLWRTHEQESLPPPPMSFFAPPPPPPDRPPHNRLIKQPRSRMTSQSNVAKRDAQNGREFQGYPPWNAQSGNRGFFG